MWVASGRAKIRSYRGSSSLLCVFLDQGVHAQVHHGELEAGEDRNDPDPAQAFFQSGERKRQADLPGFEPEPRLLADRLDVKEKEVEEMSSAWEAEKSRSMRLWGMTARKSTDRSCRIRHCGGRTDL